MTSMLLKYRRLFIVAVHLAAMAASNYASFWLRFDGEVPESMQRLYLETLPWLLAVRGLTFVPFHLYGGLWCYTGIWDLRNIIGGVATSSALFYVLMHWIFGMPQYPRSIFIMDTVLLIVLVGGLRLLRRFYRELTHLQGSRRVLIYGAGDAGEMIVRDMRRDGNCMPIGFIDDDRAKIGQRIHGVAVLGTRSELPRVIARDKPDEVLVAMPGARPATVREVVKALEPYRIPIRTVPNARSLLDGKVTLSQVRSLSIEDLLPREPVGLDPARLRELVGDRRVLVTGAGGSIGSELCRQLAALSPASLTLYERYENSLYWVVNDLVAQGAERIICPTIGDVTDAKRLDAVLSHQRPEIIFHAAAHKHVPMMEMNPCEAVKNNVIGSRMVAEAAVRFGAGRFVLISSDKAVNPSSVMGATKRVAELLMETMADRHHGTRFAAVRFGNVLGSNGSVVLRFLEQIRAGGPVTVTHPEITRYFMLISEAVQLVLHAATMVRGGEIFVLEMGEPIKVLDLARNAIRLSGFVPDEEVPITFIGLRPGEKLFEELVGTDETAEPQVPNRILRIRPRSLPSAAGLMEQVWELGRLAARGESERVIQQLADIVPTFDRDGHAAHEPISSPVARRGPAPIAVVARDIGLARLFRVEPSTIK